MAANDPTTTPAAKDEDTLRLIRELREVAEAVRPATWWLWDYPPIIPYDGILALGHACSPETILTLLDSHAALVGSLERAEQALAYYAASNYDSGRRARAVLAGSPRQTGG